MQSMFLFRAVLNITLILFVMTSEAEAAQDKVRTDRPYTVHITLKGTEKQLKEQCMHIMRYLSKIKINYVNGCSTPAEGKIIFIFEQKDYLKDKKIPNVFDEAFRMQVAKVDSYGQGQKPGSPVGSSVPASKPSNTRQAPERAATSSEPASGIQADIQGGTEDMSTLSTRTAIMPCLFQRECKVGDIPRMWPCECSS